MLKISEVPPEANSYMEKVADLLGYVGLVCIENKEIGKQLAADVALFLTDMASVFTHIQGGADVDASLQHLDDLDAKYAEMENEDDKGLPASS